MKLKVLTLNCWGIFVPCACKLKKERIFAIGKYLPKLNCDIVSLQEIWSKDDYEYLKTQLLPHFPYSHYFFSGCYGSGVCVFSKHEIIHAHKHVFTLNGYAHRIFQSDWYGGKLVGLVKICFNDIIIDFYATHMHAQYNEDDMHYDSYPHHRTLQALEMSRYINATSKDCDVVVAVGDINHRPDQLGYNILISVGELIDAWTENIATCDRPDNIFCVPSRKFPNGVKLDYIFYSANKGMKMSVFESGLEMQKVPNNNFNFSDHEGVFVIFDIEKIKSEEKIMLASKEIEERKNILKDTIEMLNYGKILIYRSQCFYFIITLIALLFLFTFQCQSIISLKPNTMDQSKTFNQLNLSRQDLIDYFRSQNTNELCVVYEILKSFLVLILILFSAFGFWHSLIILNREKCILNQSVFELALMIKECDRIHFLKNK